MCRAIPRHWISSRPPSTKSTYIHIGKRNIQAILGPLGSRAVRTYDIAVIGSGLTGLIAAGQLAKSGKKVLLAGGFGLQLPRCFQELQTFPIFGPFTSAPLQCMAADARSAWQKLEQRVGGLLTAQGALSFGLEGSAAVPLLESIMSSCLEAGVPVERLTAGEMRAMCRGAFRPAPLPGLAERPAVEPLGLPQETAGLWQPTGGAADMAAALGILMRQATTSGAVLEPALQLAGWQDRGSHFVLRLAGNQGEEVMVEVEQLALCPPVFPDAALKVFGLHLESPTSIAAMCRSTWGGSLLPLLACLGLPRPALEDASGQSSMDRWLLIPGTVPSGAVQLCQDPQDWEDATASSVSDPRGPSAEISALAKSGTRILNGLSPGLQGAASWIPQSQTPDAAPVVGYHPSFEDGRVALAFGGDDFVGAGEQLAPVLGVTVGELLRVQRPSLVDSAYVSPSRDPLQLSVQQVPDPWEGLALLQQVIPTKAVDDEK
eukprot:jgi/Botrbrau1/19054/Bobra.0100s0078.1